MSNPINPKYPLYLKNIGGKFKTINVTHEELVDLRNNNKLIPGMQYRITDYVATTSDTESRSANHPFDIIVTADDTNILNENARAIQHEGDEYFKNCNLAAWKLKYCLNNDTNRFIWAVKEINNYVVYIGQGIVETNLISDKDTTVDGYNYYFIINMGTDKNPFYIDMYTNTLNSDTPITIYLKIDNHINEGIINSIKHITQKGGKGVIYEMIDEYNNRAPYDFKGIQFKRYEGTINKNGSSLHNIPNITTPYINIDSDNFKYVYLCCTKYNFDLDMSVEAYNDYAQNYYISDYYSYGIMLLPNITIDSNDFGCPNRVFIGRNSYNISLVYNNDIYIADNCWNIITTSTSADYINIKSTSHDLINVFDCERYCNHIYSPYGDNYVKFMNSGFTSYVDDIYIVNIPTEVRDVINNSDYHHVILWYSNGKLIWYHPNLGTIETNM